MRSGYVVILVSVFLVLLQTDFTLAKKKKKSKKNKESENSKKKEGLFDSKTLKCLVCQSLAEEFYAEINKIDPKKMIDTGTFRVDGKGNQDRSVVSVLISFKCRKLN